MIFLKDLKSFSYNSCEENMKFYSIAPVKKNMKKKVLVDIKTPYF